MKKLILMSFLIFGLIGFSQERETKISPQIYVSQSVHSKVFTETAIGIGANLPLRMGTVSLLMHYQYGGNWEVSGYRDTRVAKNYLDYHLLGGELRYRILNKSSFYSPTIRIALSTEVYADEQGRYLNSTIKSIEEGYSFHPASTPQDGATAIPYMNANKLFSYYYISTPLITSVEIGNEFKLVEGLYLNLGIGISIRSIKVGYKEWYKSKQEPKSDFSNTISLRDTDKVFLFDMRLGLSYTLPSKKQSQ